MKESTQNEGTCISTASLLSLRMLSQGSHGAARTDLTVDFMSGRIAGSTYKLGADGNTPIAVAVDRQFGVNEIEAVFEVLRGVCTPVEDTNPDDASPPGGHTVFVLRRTDQTPKEVVLAFNKLGAAEFGKHFMALSRDQQRTLAQLLDQK